MRSTQKNLPTTVGSGLEKAIELIELYEELIEDVSNFDELIGALHIGAVNTIMSGTLPDALLTLRA